VSRVVLYSLVFSLLSSSQRQPTVIITLLVDIQIFDLGVRLISGILDRSAFLSRDA